MRAIALKRRVRADPRYWQEHEIFVLAEDESTTWAAAVASQEHACGLRPLPTELQSEFITPKQRKARLHQHYNQLVIQPAVRALELNGWSATPRVQNHWSAYNEDHWTIAQLLCHGISISAAQWWAQLKLQGYFTVHGASAPGPRSICSFCDLEELENIDHLFFRCSFVESSLGALLCNADTLTRRAVGSNLECLECLEDVLAWVYAVETLQKSRR